jgi:DprA winged helix domain
VVPLDPDRSSDDPLLSHMAPGEGYGLEELSTLSGLSGPELLARITELEIAGRIAVSMGIFTRVS